MPNVAIIGRGQIGGALKAHIDKLSKNARTVAWNVVYTAGCGQIYDNDNDRPTGEAFNFQTLQGLEKNTARHGKIDIVFLCIPTMDDGRIAHGYLEFFARKGIPIVTCEKGALSNYPDDLRSNGYMEKIGYSATVGGGTGMLPHIKRFVRGRRDVFVHAVLNASLNFMWEDMSLCNTQASVSLRKLQELKCTEGEGDNALSAVNKELLDAVRKTCIAWNVCMREDHSLRPKEIDIKLLTEEDLVNLIRNAKRKCCIASFRPPGTPVEEVVVGGFVTTCDGWTINLGFKNVDKSIPAFDWLPSGLNNSVLIANMGNLDSYVGPTGPGAGIEATVSAMMADARELLDISY